MSSPGDAALLVVAGALAGVVGTAGGITSLVSYPALLVVGLGALRADATNIVALVACWPGSGLASRPELAGRGPWLWRWSPVAAAGGAAGAALLVSTPADVFGRVVPYLVFSASAGLLLQPLLSATRQRRAGAGRHLLLPAGTLSVAVYNGYFGAGAGVMMLVLMLVTADEHIARANALKNMLIGAATVAAAALLAASGPVDWTDAASLGLGMFAGATAGPAVARHLPGGLLRWLVALGGLGLAVHLWLAQA